MFLCFLGFLSGQSQHIILYFPGVVAASLMDEHGFLPGKKFQFYPAVDKHDLHGMKLRVELHDLRDSLHLQKLECSPVEFTGTSEFEGIYGAKVAAAYFDTLLPAAQVILDTTATDVLKVNLEGFDARLVGAMSIRAHGLCRMSVEWKGNTRVYCVDITDKDPHSPISSHAFVTRKTATRVIASAALREAIERILADLESGK